MASKKKVRRRHKSRAVASHMYSRTERTMHMARVMRDLNEVAAGGPSGRLPDVLPTILRMNDRILERCPYQQEICHA
jgi:hypothetical protein